MNDYYDQSIVECSQNHNLITNFSISDRWLYEAAILHYGKDDICITDDAYWMDGTPDESMNALRYKSLSANIVGFWEIFAEIEKMFC